MTAQPVFVDGLALIRAKQKGRKPFATLVDRYRLQGVSDAEIMRAMTKTPAMISPTAMAGDLFGEAVSDDPVVGVEIIIPKRQCTCEHTTFVTGPGKAMHKAALVCAKCGKHGGWLSAEAHSFVAETIRHFGKPTEPVVIRIPDETGSIA